VKLPKRIFVRIERDGKEEYPATYLALEDCDENGETIGVYELVETGKLKIEHSLQAERK
jgi:hypothetical protein